LPDRSSGLCIVCLAAVDGSNRAPAGAIAATVVGVVGDSAVGTDGAGDVVTEGDSCGYSDADSLTAHAPESGQPFGDRPRIHGSGYQSRGEAHGYDAVL